MGGPGAAATPAATVTQTLIPPGQVKVPIGRDEENMPACQRHGHEEGVKSFNQPMPSLQPERTGWKREVGGRDQRLTPAAAAGLNRSRKVLLRDHPGQKLIARPQSGAVVRVLRSPTIQGREAWRGVKFSTVTNPEDTRRWRHMVRG